MKYTILVLLQEFEKIEKFLTKLYIQVIRSLVVNVINSYLPKNVLIPAAVAQLRERPTFT
jgi:hypothetical protein